jgi:hypothetical protein
MVEKKTYEPGTFCWVELATSDASAGKTFYTSLLGWTFQDMPGGAGPYTLLKKNGKDVAGLYAIRPDQQGMPPNWSSYVSVESADQSAAKAKELGGTVLMEPFEVEDLGRMAVIRDPDGAFFSLWQPRQLAGAGVVNEPGAFCWNELYTTDPKKAADFYTGLFGWTRNARHMDFGEYVIFEKGGSMMAGMMKTPKEWGPIPPHWLVYFAVDDADRTVENAKSLGANAMFPPMDIENVGRFSILTDPQGAGFAVIKLKSA